MDDQTELEVGKILAGLSDNLENGASRLRFYLQDACATLEEGAADFRYRLVEARHKKHREAVRALAEQDLPPGDVLKVDDLVGARVVVVSPSDIRTLIGYIQQDAQCPVKDLRVQKISDPSGYRATHLKGWLQCGSKRAGCEVQIRTALADAWAVVSRADLYRRKDLAELLPKMAQVQARTLAAVDDALELIREEANRPPPAKPEAIDRHEEKPAPQVVTPKPVRVETRVSQPSVVQSPPKDEVFVQENPVSRRLVDAFYESFLEDRRKAAATELLFRRANAFRRSDDWNDELAAGFNVLIYKGPFVEGSNWLPYHTWEFAVAAERHLLNRFEQLLKKNAELRSGGVELSWPAIFDKVDEFRSELRNRGYTPSAIVIAGHLQVDLMVDLHKHAVPHWELPKELQAPWIEGTYEGSPILNIREAPAPQTLYVADLAAFGTLTKYSPDAKYNVDEIDEARAREILDRNPKAVVIPEGRPDSVDERLRLLQLRVWLRLYESYDIQVKNPQAVLGALLASAGEASQQGP